MKAKDTFLTYFMIRTKVITLCLTIALFSVIGGTSFGQSISTHFGKNRVQFHDDFNKWWMYETPNFVTYWYGKGRNVAQAVIQLAELDHDEIQNIMEHRFNDKIVIVVYLDITDLKQSNIGAEETFIGETGQTRIIGNKMFVYFDGDHQNLRRKIREGIAKVYLNSLLAGNTIQDLVRNSLQVNVPEWYQRGLISYLGSYWDHLIEDEFRDLWVRDDGRFRDFDKLSRDHPRLAGHSFWYFMDQNYGKSTISNLLYLARINRNIDDSFLFVLGISLEALLLEWQAYYGTYFEGEKNMFEDPEGKIDSGNKMDQPISQIKFSPNGEWLAYAYNDIGKYRVVLRNLYEGTEDIIFKYGHKNAIQETDFNYPIVCWHPNGSELTIVYEHRDRIKLRKIRMSDLSHIEQVLPEEFHRVYSASYVNNLDYMFSASTDGFSDLYLYYSQTRQSKALTNDYHDDLDAEYVRLSDGREGILFSSNRPETVVLKEKLDTILPVDNFDLFFYDFENAPDNMERITDTPEESERQPYFFNEEDIIYLCERSGIINQYTINFYTGKSKAARTNLNRNIIIHHSPANADVSSYTLYDDGAYKMYIPEQQLPKQINYTQYRQQTQDDIPDNFVLLPAPEVEEKPDKEYFFQSKFPDPPVVESIDVEVVTTTISDPFADLFSTVNDDNPSIIKFNSARAVAGRTTFKVFDVVTRLDNEVLFEGLESYAGDDIELQTVPVGILLKATAKDLFEDYDVEGGVRIPTRFNGTEYFLTLSNKKRLLDQHVTMYRKATTDRVDDLSFPVQKTKRSVFLTQYGVRYPLDIYRSIRGLATLRFDKFFYLATDAASSSIPSINEQRLQLRFEYIFDNTIEYDYNIRHGSRYKFYVEALNRFDLQVKNGFSFDPSTGFTTVMGFDARHYIPVLRHSAFAIRGAGATSIGSEKILYYIGGVEDWLIPSFNEGVPVPQETNFSYKAIAAHLRGFDINSRNGASYVLMNSEFRFPIFKYLSKRPLRSSFLRSFQLVGFFDAGMAWHGLSPTGEENPLNTVVVGNPPVVSIKANYFRDPLIMGYGVGLRTSIFGYFLRFDYAWGIESRKVQDPKFYFSIGTDF